MTAAPPDTRLSALLAAILANPADDTPRLVYADELEEAGQGEWAEFIRVQCELARMGFADGCPCCKDYGGPCDTCESIDVEDLRRREHELLANGIDVPGQRLAQPRRDWSGKELTYIGNAEPSQARWNFIRGFVHTVRCSLAAWLEHGPRIVRKHPVERVVLTNREPTHDVIESTYRDSHTWYWYAEGTAINAPAAIIPGILTRHMNAAIQADPGAFSLGNTAGFETVAAAMSALSAGCIAWAKSVR